MRFDACSARLRDLVRAAVWLACGLCLATPAPAEDEMAERRARIAAMTAAEREQLARRYDRFMALAPEEQERLRALHRALEQDPAASELRAVMARYHRWLSGLSTAQRAELLAMEPDERLEKIRELRLQERARERRRLSPEDRLAVRRWVEGLVRSRIFPQEWKQLEAMPDPQRRAELARLAMQRRQQTIRWLMANEESLNELREAISPQARKALDAEDTPAGRRAMLGAWIRQAFGDLYARGPIKQRLPPEPEVLMRFMSEELSPQERQELTGLSEDELLLRLQRMYFQRQMRRPQPKKSPREAAPWDRNRPKPQREQWP